MSRSGGTVRVKPQKRSLNNIIHTHLRRRPPLAEAVAGKVPRMDRALPLWTALSIRCRRKNSNRGSREASSNLQPKALTNSMAPGPHTPKVNGDRNEYVRMSKV